MKLSLITICLNDAETLPMTLSSVAAQEGVDFEYIVVDGGSSDGTVALLESAEALVSQWLSDPDEGLYHALNRGLELATGDVVGLIHADDLFADAQVLRRVMTAFGNPDIQFVYGDLEYVARQDPGRVVRYWRAGPFAPEFLGRGWMPPHPTVYVRASVLARFGGYDTGFRIAADYDWMLRVLSGLDPGQVAYLPEVLVRMRQGGASNRSLGNLLTKSREDYRALRRNGIGGIGALAWKNLSKLGQFVRRASM